MVDQLEKLSFSGVSAYTDNLSKIQLRDTTFHYVFSYVNFSMAPVADFPFAEPEISPPVDGRLQSDRKL